MGKYTGWFFVELEGATQHLPERERAQIQDELSDHLDADIQARLELGEPPEVAERNAVKAMGQPVRIARSFRKDVRRIDFPIVIAVAGCGITYVVGAAFVMHAGFPFLVSAFLAFAGALLYRLLVRGVPSRRTTFWGCTIMLAILSLGLPLARVSPPYDDSVDFPVASFDTELVLLETAHQEHLLAILKADGLPPSVLPYYRGGPDWEELRVRELHSVIAMSPSARLRRGFLKNLPIAEFGAGLMFFALLAPEWKKSRHSRPSRVRTSS